MVAKQHDDVIISDIDKSLMCTLVPILVAELLTVGKQTEVLFIRNYYQHLPIISNTYKL